MRGVVAGIAGALSMSILNYILFHLLDFTSLRLLDYGAIILFNHKAASLPEAILGLLGQFFFSAVIGVMLAYFLTLVNSRYYLFKGWFFSVAVWFFVFAAGSAFRLPHLISPPWRTVVTNFLTASIYGLVTVKILEWMDKRIKS